MRQPYRIPLLEQMMSLRIAIMSTVSHAFRSKLYRLTRPDCIGDGLAACPVCSTRMKLDLIDAHLNTCLHEFPHIPSKSPISIATDSSPHAGDTIGKGLLNKPERLPHLNYSLFKEAALRKKLQDLGIPNYGNRQILIRRHSEWVTLWNANCDASKPRKKVDLLRDLETWERTQGGRAAAANSGLNTGSQLLHKDFDNVGWATKHDQSFQELIANARKSLKKSEHITDVIAVAPRIRGNDGEYSIELEDKQRGQPNSKIMRGHDAEDTEDISSNSGISVNNSLSGILGDA